MARKSAKPVEPDNEWSVDLTVVGLKFRTKKDVRQVLAQACPFDVDFQREAGNKYDANAIMVSVSFSSSLKALHGKHIGYLSAKIAGRLAPKLDENKIEFVAATIESIDVEQGDARCHCSFRNL